MRYLLLGAAAGALAGALLAAFLLLIAGDSYEWVDSVVGTALMGAVLGLAVGIVALLRKQRQRRPRS